MNQARSILLMVLVAALLPMVVLAGEEKPDLQAAAVGAGLYRAYCASCHGTEAKGDGSVAEFLRVKPANLTKIAKRHDGAFSLEEVKKIIDGRVQVKGHGVGEMPVWGDALLVAQGGATEEQAQKKISDLANYLWTIQEK